MTPEQEFLFKEALGDSSNWPKFTMDAEVNYEVNRKIHPEFDMCPWNQATPAEKALYLEEIVEAKKAGLD